jgi:hypothetical protein
MIKVTGNSVKRTLFERNRVGLHSRAAAQMRPFYILARLQWQSWTHPGALEMAFRRRLFDSHRA